MTPLQIRGANYIACFPFAIAGQGGSDVTFDAAQAITRGLLMPLEDAHPVLSAWNQTHCQPPWSDGDLWHKLRDSLANGKKPLGYLLKDSDVSTLSPAREREASLRPSVPVDSADDKAAANRLLWPKFDTPTTSELATIARLRSVPFQACSVLANVGLLKTCTEGIYRCYVIAEGTFAQKRRMDGGTFTTSDGQKEKMNFLGSRGAFVGRAWLDYPSDNVILCEGIAGLLEVAAAWFYDGLKANWVGLAAASAGSRFAADPGLLKLLAGKRVVIVRDNDTKGDEAATAWKAELQAVGCTVRILKPPGSIGDEGYCKDLGPIVAEPQRHKSFITHIFSK